MAPPNGWEPRDGAVLLAVGPLGGSVVGTGLFFPFYLHLFRFPWCLFACCFSPPACNQATTQRGAWRAPCLCRRETEAGAKGKQSPVSRPSFNFPSWMQFQVLPVLPQILSPMHLLAGSPMGTRAMGVGWVLTAPRHRASSWLHRAGGFAAVLCIPRSWDGVI